MNIENILKQHKAWLEGNGGEMANLSGADLRCAKLRGANLNGADLRCADLSHANLRCADLSHANLRGANLCRADLRRANLNGADLYGANLNSSCFIGAVGFVLLPVQDNRGYSFVHAVKHGDEWVIKAGCRSFSIDRALEHWGRDAYPDKMRGAMYVNAVKWLQGYIENLEADDEG